MPPLQSRSEVEQHAVLWPLPAVRTGMEGDGRAGYDLVGAAASSISLAVGSTLFLTNGVTGALDRGAGAAFGRPRDEHGGGYGVMAALGTLASAGRPMPVSAQSSTLFFGADDAAVYRWAMAPAPAVRVPTPPAGARPRYFAAQQWRIVVDSDGTSLCMVRT